MNILFLAYPLFVIICFLVFIYIAPSINLIDLPNSRKKHKGEIPLIGGIVGGISIFLFCFIFVNDNEIISILILATVILIIGIIDDAFEINFSIRLFVQFLIIMIAIGLGFSVKSIGFYEYFGQVETRLFYFFCYLFINFKSY